MGSPKSAIWRFVRIDERLRAAEPPTARRLATELEVSIRTVYRDIDYLRDRLKAPVEYDHAAGGYRYTQPSYRLPALTLTEGELLALYLAERTLRQYRGTPYERELRNLIAKLEPLLPDEVTLDLGALDAFYSFRASSVSVQDAETFRELAACAIERRRVRIEYYSASADHLSVREVDPYHLANVDGEWYLFGHCHTRSAVRVFRPDRIRTVERLEATFERPPDFTPAAHFEASLAIYRESGPLKRVVLEFDPFAARFIREKLWHASQELRLLRDGRAILTLRLSSFVEVKRFALAWGEHCRARSPKGLVEEMREEIGRMGRGYEGSEPNEGRRTPKREPRRDAPERTSKRRAAGTACDEAAHGRRRRGRGGP